MSEAPSKIDNSPDLEKVGIESKEERDGLANDVNADLLKNREKVDENEVKDISPSEFKKLKYRGDYSQMLRMISGVSEVSELRENSLVSFDFKGNYALEVHVGLGDVVPPSVRKVSANGVVFTRRANQGFYNEKGRYLAIRTNSTVTILENDVNYQDGALGVNKEVFGENYSENGSLELSREQESQDVIEKKYLRVVAADYNVDPSLLESILKHEDNKYQSNDEFLHLTARYLANAAAKFEAKGKEIMKNQSYTSEFVNFALGRLNLTNSFVGKPSLYKKIIQDYGKAKGVEILESSSVDKLNRYDQDHFKASSTPGWYQEDPVEVSDRKNNNVPRLQFKETVRGDLMSVESKIGSQESPTGEEIYLQYSNNPELKNKPPHYVMFFGGNMRNLNDTLSQSQIRQKVEQMQRSGVNAVLVVPAPRGNRRDHETTNRWSHFNQGTFDGVKALLNSKGFSAGKWNLVAWSGGYKGVGNILKGMRKDDLNSISMLDATYGDRGVLQSIADFANQGVKVSAYTQGNIEEKTNVGANILARMINNKKNFSYHNFGNSLRHFDIGNGALLQLAIAEGAEIDRTVPLEAAPLVADKGFNREIIESAKRSMSSPGFEKYKRKGGCEDMANFMVRETFQRLAQKHNLPRQSWRGVRNSPIDRTSTAVLRGKNVSDLTEADLDKMRVGQVLFMALPERYNLRRGANESVNPVKNTARHWVTYLGKDANGEHVFQDNLKNYDSYGLATLKRIFGERRNWDNHEAASVGHGVSERVIISVHDPYLEMREV